MTKPIDADRSVLVLVDYQPRLLPAIQGGAQALAEAVRLADVARLLGIRVVGTQQNPEGLGCSDEAIGRRCDAMLTKMHFDACADGLIGLLNGPDRPAPREVVIGGCEAHVCLLQTALGLLRAGLTVRVVAQATGSRTAENRELALERLRLAGASIVGSEMVIFEWLQSCEHPDFRQVLALVKSGLP